MSKTNFYFDSGDGKTKIHAVKFIPSDEPKAVLQITHGMVEFIDRYDDFAQFLCDRGFVVVGHDHLGHGESIISKDDYGYFARRKPNRVVLDDIHTLTRLTKEEYPSLPYFLLGHSMGSFYARQYVCDYGSELSGAVIMGTGYQPAGMVKAGLAIINFLGVFTGWRNRSKFVHSTLFGSNNKKFEPARTGADWLSRDEAQVDKYVADERCSFSFTLNGYRGMMTGIARLTKKKVLEQMPKNLPLMIVSGEDDPVGDYGSGVRKVAAQMEFLGMNNVYCKLYPEYRHEILNEIGRDKVYTDILNWMEGVLATL